MFMPKFVLDLTDSAQILYTSIGGCPDYTTKFDLAAGLEKSKNSQKLHVTLRCIKSIRQSISICFGYLKS